MLLSASDFIFFGSQVLLELPDEVEVVHPILLHQGDNESPEDLFHLNQVGLVHLSGIYLEEKEASKHCRLEIQLPARILDKTHIPSHQFRDQEEVISTFESPGSLIEGSKRLHETGQTSITPISF
jgi:hypothetical protein